MYSYIAPFLIYIFVLIGVYCVRKWLHMKRLKYYREVDILLWKYFCDFQKIINTYDSVLYRSDKAYPVLTNPMKQWLLNHSHSIESFRHFKTKLNDEWVYLEELVWESIGKSPLLTYRLKKRTRALNGIEELLWFILAFLTFGIRVVWSKR